MMLIFQDICPIINEVLSTVPLLVVNTPSAMNSANMSESTADCRVATHLPTDYPPQLPPYEEAVGIKNVARLPSYRQSRPAPRYHPYCRRPAARVDSSGIDKFMVRLPQTLITFHRSQTLH